MRNVQSVVFFDDFRSLDLEFDSMLQVKCIMGKNIRIGKKNKLIWVYHLSTYQKGYKSYPVDVFKIPEVVEISEDH